MELNQPPLDYNAYPHTTNLYRDTAYHPPLCIYFTHTNRTDSVS